METLKTETEVTVEPEVEPVQVKRVERQLGDLRVIDIFDMKTTKEPEALSTRSIAATIQDHVDKNLAPFQREKLSGLMVFQHDDLGPHAIVYERQDRGLAVYDIVFNQTGAYVNSAEVAELGKVMGLPVGTEVTTSIKCKYQPSSVEDGEGVVDQQLETLDEIRSAIADYAHHNS